MKEAGYNYHQMKKLVNDHFRNQLQLNHLRIERIPWIKLQKADFINWPENLSLKGPGHYNAIEMKTLLSRLENIRFSECFLKSYREIL